MKVQERVQRRRSFRQTLVSPSGSDWLFSLRNCDNESLLHLHLFNCSEPDCVDELKNYTALVVCSEGQFEASVHV